MNLPTKITVARIALIPLLIIVYCLNSVFDYYFALMTFIYVLASCTDFVDGHIARKYNMVTDLGKFLDPIADKILVVAGIFLIFEMGLFPLYFGVICCTLIISREFIIGVFRQLAASKGCVMAADKLGKAKTIVTLIAIPALMLSPLRDTLSYAKAGVIVGDILYYGGLVMFALATLLTVISGINYIMKNKSVISDNKSAKASVDDGKGEGNE